MRTLSIDIETFSSTPLDKCGVYKYVQSPDFEILLFAYKYDDPPYKSEEPVRLIDLTDFEEIPEGVIDDLTNPSIIKTAFNAAFEITCLSTYLKRKLPVDQWECTQAKSASLGLPLSLEGVGTALNLKIQKDAAGKALVKYFTVPCKPTKANGMRTRNHPYHDLEKWNRFKSYNVTDVIVEREVIKKISVFEWPASEKKIWQLDQKINATGILIDTKFAQAAIDIDAIVNRKLTAEAVVLTNLDNPNSRDQLIGWLNEENEDLEIVTLRKDDLPKYIKASDSLAAKRVLEIRTEMAKASVKKYAAMTRVACADGRFYGGMQYFGASTGRWAGRIVQPHNMPTNIYQEKDLDNARMLVSNGDIEMLEMLYGNVPDVLSQLTRTAFIASPGCRLLCSDFSQIEARILAWLAGEKWRIDLFRAGGPIYETSAAKMFRIPLEWVTKNSHWRKKGKISELALGYQGAVEALKRMGAVRMGVDEKDLPMLVAVWRQTNPRIVNYWRAIGDAAVQCFKTGQALSVGLVTFMMERNVFFIKLPSGRRIAYIKPFLSVNAWGGDMLCYHTVDSKTRRWKSESTYGGKLVENIVQATARDLLAEAMIRVDAAGYNIALHVHDEVICDQLNGKGSLAELNAIMGQPVPWARGLPLAAEGHETQYYKKD